MADWPQALVLPHGAVTITPHSLHSIGAATGSLGNPGSSAWPAADRAIYIPFRIAQPILVVKMFMINGATVNGNVDLGIYDPAGVRLVSMGSTAQAGASALQTFDITDTQIGPGLFYMALAIDNTTATTIRESDSSGVDLAVFGCAQEASAFPLPATATFAAISSG